ncbi:barren [Rozella allomycis CSF55]|uniref:Condensin complex subunit 2 n=1 Tax=Rozella allomycis (strain CSF55) TaxID=988480 RepID=A0A4P9YP57_ROZAC|nr:barren [Rozella allomycis CSF55]
MTRQKRPLMSPFNDDATEIRKKRRNIMQERQRRSLALLSPSPMQSPKQGRPLLLSPTGGRLLFQSPNKQKQQMVLSNEKPAVIPSKEIASKQFEEWIKIAADNKINVNNTWNLALIDYFSEMSLLRDGDSINFQKASCTLDGCVKIYTSRVDSVATETGKLLSGLSESEKSNDGKANIKDKDEEDDEEVNVEKVKRRNRVNTIEKNLAHISIKNFDLEFDVDPLFKKTSADFDEGGARGLLLNNLMITSSGKILFDSSEAVDVIDEEIPSSLERNEELDISKLIDKFIPDIEDVFSRDICPTFKDYSIGDSTNSMTIDMQEMFKRIEDNVPLQIEELINEEDINNFDFNEGFEENEDILPEQINEETQQQRIPIEEEFLSSMANEKENIFSYFDSKIFKNWAGPEHWKLTNFIKTKNSINKPTKQKKEKKEFFIDFFSMEPINLDQLFATKATNQAPITFTRNNLQEQTKNIHLLPDDFQISSKEFTCLFTKPKFTLKPSTRVKFVQGKGFDSNQLEYDNTNYNDNNNDCNDNVDDVSPMGDVSPTAQPLDLTTTQQRGSLFNDNLASEEEEFAGFDFNEDDDIPTSQPFYNGLELDFDFGNTLVAEPKLTKSLKMNYAKTSKKVDVKKLKENIWTEIETVPQNNTIDFKNIVNGLSSFYPEEKFRDISVPFCFICVLHLANENGLEIKGSSTLSELQIIKEVSQ